MNPGWMLLALGLVSITGVTTAAQSSRKSDQKANESDRVLVSRSVAKTEAESSHVRKGKKGLPATIAKRTEPPATAARARTTGAPPQTVRKAPSRSANSSRETTSAKSESSGSEESAPAPPPVLAASDRIEVVEWGARASGNVQALPTPAPVKPGSSTRRYEVDMDPGRVQQIQQALISRGFLTGEPTSVYDEATIDAMRQFQISQKIDATGYPTAHALKRLGL